MLSHLEPAEDVTGGLWFDEGELDTDLVEEIGDFALHYIGKLGWQELPAPPKAGSKKTEVYIDLDTSDDSSDDASDDISDDEHNPSMQKDTATNKRKRVVEISDDDEVPAKRTKAVHTSSNGKRKRDPEAQLQHEIEKALFKTPKMMAHPKEEPRYPISKGLHGRPLIPRPPGYRGYPTTPEILKRMQEYEAVAPEKMAKFKEADLQAVLDALEHEGRVGRIMDGGYRTDRMVGQPKGRRDGQVDPLETTAGNAIVYSACGQCPVRNVCEEGGPVSPQNCIYFDKWYDLDGDTIPAELLDF